MQTTGRQASQPPAWRKSWTRDKAGS
jgi:hypothetical protein